MSSPDLKSRGVEPIIHFDVSLGFKDSYPLDNLIFQHEKTLESVGHQVYVAKDSEGKSVEYFILDSEGNMIERAKERRLVERGHEEGT